MTSPLGRETVGASLALVEILAAWQRAARASALRTRPARLLRLSEGAENTEVAPGKAGTRSVCSTRFEIVVPDLKSAIALRDMGINSRVAAGHAGILQFLQILHSIDWVRITKANRRGSRPLLCRNLLFLARQSVTAIPSGKWKRDDGFGTVSAIRFLRWQHHKTRIPALGNPVRDSKLPAGPRETGYAPPTDPRLISCRSGRDVTRNVSASHLLWPSNSRV